MENTLNLPMKDASQSFLDRTLKTRASLPLLASPTSCWVFWFGSGGGVSLDKVLLNHGAQVFCQKGKEKQSLIAGILVLKFPC
ncbi:hypothetical protein MUK42_36557 [Musa troglodytarum]|uniref:Uncharacterized protein n=1 Tax=Musa troglodytarum TaxID=320322 RepID=A0A9E7JD54_9LILI|nr:hypothetical protein MUK42_36557 [Musa troglodytarum]